MKPYGCKYMRNFSVSQIFFEKFTNQKLKNDKINCVNVLQLEV